MTEEKAKDENGATRVISWLDLLIDGPLRLAESVALIALFQFARLRTDSLLIEVFATILWLLPIVVVTWFLLKAVDLLDYDKPLSAIVLAIGVPTAAISGTYFGPALADAVNQFVAMEQTN